MQAWTIPSVEKENWRRGNGERAIIVLYNEGLHGENVASNSCERLECEQGQLALNEVDSHNSST